MALGRPLRPLELSEPGRVQLESIANSRSLAHGLVRREVMSIWCVNEIRRPSS